MLMKPVGIISAAGGGAPAFAETPVTFDETQFLNHADGTQPVAGLTGSKQYFIFISFTPAADIAARTFFAYDGSNNRFYHSAQRPYLDWKDVLGASIAANLNASLNIALGVRGNYLISLDNAAGGVRQIGGERNVNPVGWREASEPAAATDQDIAFHLARSGAATGLGIANRQDGLSSAYEGTMARLAIWQGVAPNIGDSAWRTANLAKFYDSATGVIADPALSVALLGAPILDLYGTAAEWNTQTGPGTWGNLTMNGAVT